MPSDNDDRTVGWYRRSFVKGALAAGVLAGVPAAAARGGRATTADENGQELPDPQGRIASAERVSARDFHEENYEIIHVHRRKEAIRTLLSDPEVNAVAREWIANFIGYEPLSNHLDAISIQGPTDYTVEGGHDTGRFEITARNRQTAYGLVDRRRNDLVALQINDPIDVSWVEEYDEQASRRTQTMLDDPDVAAFLEGKDWWPMEKVAESITAWKDMPHGSVSIVILYAVDDDGVEVASGYVDVTNPESPELVDVHFVEDFTRYPVQQLARETSPTSGTLLGILPRVPREKRPLKTANNGFHRFELVPEKTFEQDNWRVEWEPPTTMGVTFTGRYMGKPVFQTLNAVSTPTGYGLPPREGRNSRDWFFPTREPIFSGHHLFWDIHSIPFGGPGQLGKIDYPERRGHPAGFQFRTHYHTGAQGRGSTDFHSGAQFGPYNYNISYEFFEDGRLIPIWRRHGPGYVVESLRNYGIPEDWDDEEPVVQQYLHLTALDVTPGTTDGVRTQIFDGDRWLTPETEFYLEGEPGQKVRFSNPGGPETIDVPLNRDLEVVVVRRRPGDIGPAKSQKTRVEDMDAELAFYHPAQYADGDAIQDQRVIAWLVMEASMDEVPHPAGVSGYVAQAELQLEGYGD